MVQANIEVGPRTTLSRVTKNISKEAGASKTPMARLAMNGVNEIQELACDSVNWIKLGDESIRGSCGEATKKKLDTTV